MDKIDYVFLIGNDEEEGAVWCPSASVTGGYLRRYFRLPFFLGLAIAIGSMSFSAKNRRQRPSDKRLLNSTSRHSFFP